MVYRWTMCGALGHLACDSSRLAVGYPSLRIRAGRGVSPRRPDVVYVVFLHGGFWHIAGNIGFLWIFGDDVEHLIGRKKYALLLLAAALIGNACHAWTHLNSTIPAIGASGGISGVLAYYAMAFPHAPLTVPLWPFSYIGHGVRVTAFQAFVSWLGLQLVMTFVSGSDGVATMAHCGGAAAGLATWFFTREIPTQNDGRR